MDKMYNLNQVVRTAIMKHHLGFSSPIDKYSKWAPLFCILFLPVMGVRMRSSLQKRFLLVFLSKAILNAAVYPLKKLTNEKRPNLAFKNDSFPSSHSATSFMGAEILRQELKLSYPVMSSFGYGIGILTSVLRILKNKHWLSDVLAGAAIGFLAARFTCMLVNKINSNKTNHAVKYENYSFH